MAFIVGELAAPISIDQKPFDKGLDEVKKKGDNWAKDMGKSWSKAGEGIEKVGKKWTTGVTLPILGAGAAVITTAANFESSMNRVRGLTGATGDDFEKLRDQARELGATTQYSASEAADGMGFLAMAGFKTNEILGAMPSVLELAASAQMDLASAADITSNILTGYGKNVSELGHVNDVLVKAMTSANVDLNMLGESLKYVGPIASGVGLEFEEVAAAVGLLGNAGIQGSMAGTSLRQAITALVNPSKQAFEKMFKLGLEVTDTEGNLKSLTGIVEELEDKSISAADMMAIFGQRAGPAMVSLVEQGSDALGDFTANLKESEGAAKAIAEVNMQGAKGAFLELKSAGEELALSIADSGILGQITDIAKGAADWLRETSKTNPELLKMGVNLALTAAAAGPLISTTGKITKGVGGIFTLIGKLNPKLGKTAEGLAGAGGAATGAGTKFAALGAAAGPIALATVAAAGLVTAFVILDNNVREKTKSIEQQVEERFTKAAETAARKVADMNRAVSDEFEGMSDNIIDQLLHVKIGATEVSDETYQSILDDVENMRTRAVEQLGQYKTEGLQALNDYYAELGQLESDEYAQAIGNLEAHYDEKQTKIEGAYGEINTIIAKAMTEGREVTQEEWDKILAILDGANNEIVDKERLLEGEIAAVKASITDDTKKATKERAKAVIGILEEHHQNELDEIAEQSDKRIEALVAAYGRGEIATMAELDKQLEVAKSHELEKTKIAKEGFVERLNEQQWALDATGQSIDEGSGNILNKLETWWVRFNESYARSLEAQGSTAALFGYGVGETQMNSYTQAVEDNTPGALGAAQDVVDGIAEKLGKMESQAQAGGEAISSGVAAGIQANASAAIAAAESLANSINQKFRSTLEIASPSGVMEDAGFELPAGVAKGILGNLGIVRDASIAMADMISMPKIYTPQAAGVGNISNNVPVNINVYGPVTKDTVTKIGDVASKSVARVLQQRGQAGAFR